MKKTYEQFLKEINDRFCGKITVVGDYNGNKQKTIFHCNIHDIDFSNTPQSIMHSKYGCPSCAKEGVSDYNIKNHINCKYGRMVDERPDLVQMWDYDRNIGVDINNVSLKSGKKIWWICVQCKQPYQAKVCDITSSKKLHVCAKCNNKNFSQKKVVSYLSKNGSFAEHYPNLVEEWDYELNENLIPSNFTDKSNRKVWWKCKDCFRPWRASIAKRTEGRGCPYCARHTKSDLQIKVEDYIREVYMYKLLHEHNCTLICKNPQTGFRLLYDNEVCISDNIRLIIECHGQQHYEVCGWSYTQAKAEGCSPEEVLEYQQWKDEYKKQYALDNGYYYLVVPYWTEQDQAYKIIIDSKIHKILQS